MRQIAQTLNMRQFLLSMPYLQVFGCDRLEVTNYVYSSCGRQKRTNA